MAGILNKKDRLIDFVITNNGRSQIQNNDIRYCYASISDKSIVYTKDFEKTHISKSNISKSEIDYIPLEALSNIKFSEKNINNNSIDSINPEFDLLSMFSYNNEKTINIDLDDLVNNINFENSVNEIISDISLISKLENLDFLTTKSLLNSNKKIEFRKTSKTDFIFNFENKLNIYPTIESIDLSVENIPVIALDKRFSHKNNFKIMLPKDSITKENLYDLSQFRNIDKLDVENTIGYLFRSYNSNFTSIKKNVINSREDEIMSIIEDMNNNSDIFRKHFTLDTIKENCKFTFEIFENFDDLNNESSTKIVKTNKLCIIKIDELYDKKSRTTKKIYQAGKIINSRNDSENNDLDFIFNFNNTSNNLLSNKVFAISAYYSFVCLFTIVIE